LTVWSHGHGKIYNEPFSEILLHAKKGQNQLAVASSVTIPAVFKGGRGHDTLIAGGGDDTLYAGSGRDLLVGGSGVDSLVAVGTGRDTLSGGVGEDSFWALSGDVVRNISPVDAADGAVHWVSQPVTAPSSTAAATGAALLEPATGESDLAYESFAADPLFSPAGPAANDVVQGGLGDCFFLAVLAAIAGTDPGQIRQEVVELADGTFLVRFSSKGTIVYEHVDAELPTYSNGQLAYAQLGQGDSLWVAIMEKAFAIFRDNQDSYADISAGWMNEVYTDLGLTTTTTDQASQANAGDMMSLIQSELAENQAVTVAILTVTPDAPLLADHAYSVDSVVVTDGVVTGLTLRNPWGNVGVAGYAPNNGLVTITPDQAFSNIFSITAGAA
jgi:hypothetical protein